MIAKSVGISPKKKIGERSDCMFVQLSSKMRLVDKKLSKLPEVIRFKTTRRIIADKIR